MEFLNRIPSEELRGLKEEFERTMWHIYHIIGDNAFRIPTEYERRRPISMTYLKHYIISSSRLCK